MFTKSFLLAICVAQVAYAQTQPTGPPVTTGPDVVISSIAIPNGFNTTTSVITSGTGSVTSGTGSVTSGTGSVTSGTGSVTSGTGSVTTHTSSRRTTSYCPTSHHTRTKHHHHHHHHHHCYTKTRCTTIDKTKCWILECPCPTNSHSTRYTTVYVSPTVAPTVAPTSAAVQPVCTPCTNYVTVTSKPSLVCSTMIFCDIADQNENCIAQNNQHIESIVSMAVRQGGQVFVNGQLVVFNTAERSGASVVVSSGSSVVTVTGQQANDASNIGYGNSVIALFGGIALFLFAGI